MQEHTLKMWPTCFDAVKRGDKPFTVRRDHRGFQRGDVVVFHQTCEDALHRVEYDFNGEVKHTLRRKITYVLTGGQLGIEPGYVVLGLAAISEDG